MHSVPRSTPAFLSWLLPLGTLCFMCGILIGRSAPVWHPALLAGLFGMAAAGLLRHRLRAVAMLLCALCLGALLGWRAWHPALPAEGTYTVTGTVAQMVSLREDGQVQTVLQEVTLDGQPFGYGVYWTYYLNADEALPEGLTPGARVTLTARVYHPQGKTTQGGFDFREYLLQRGVTVGLYGADELTTAPPATLEGWMARLRHDLSLRLMDVMGTEHGAYAAAMLLGEQDFIADSDLAAFRNLGIAHILSVSGYHVGVLAGMLLLLLRPLGLSPRMRLPVEGLLLGAYCLLTGGHAPVVRAALLLLWRTYSRLRHHQVAPLHVLCVTACVQLLFNPTLLLGASFQLTYCAMLGVLLVQPTLRGRYQGRLVRLWEGLSASLAAQIGVLLPQLYWFGSLPLLALLVNMPVLAYCGLLMTLYWLTLAALPVPILREALGMAACGATEFLLAAVRELGALEGISLWTRQADLLTALGWGLLMLGLCAGLPGWCRRHRGFLVLTGVCLMLTILLPLPAADPTYTQYDVGSADAAILRDGGYTLVIDAGEDGQTIASALHQQRRSVDLLILTHLHSDHAGGLRALLDAGIPVAVCCLPAGAEAALADEGILPLLAELVARGTEVKYLSRGDVLALPSGSLTVLWPRKEPVMSGGDANDTSLVLLAEVRGVTMLLTGDLPGRYEQYVQLPADVLKAAHHGSTGSTLPDFLQAVDPTVLLLSNGSEARSLSMAERAGDIPLYATDARGSITLTFMGGGSFSVSGFLGE